jgi:thiamine-monophosphate kinase
VAVLDGIYTGLGALAARFGVAVVGGNVAATDGPLIVDITLLGRVARSTMLQRSGGRVGDAVLVTGTLGAAAAGALIMQASGSAPHAPGTPGAVSAVSDALLARAREAQVAPAPRVAEGRALAATGVVTAMLDVSDGLLADLGHLCAASGTGAELEAAAVPVDAAADVVAAAYGAAYRHDALELALTGGEDYELVFTVAPEHVPQGLDAVRQAGGTARVIGRLTAAETGLRLRDARGDTPAIEPRGWDHLRPAAS